MVGGNRPQLPLAHAGIPPRLLPVHFYEDVASEEHSYDSFLVEVGCRRIGVIAEELAEGADRRAELEVERDGVGQAVCLCCRNEKLVVEG